MTIEDRNGELARASAEIIRLRTALATARNDVLEEAARLHERIKPGASYNERRAREEYAEAIRALKEKSDAE